MYTWLHGALSAQNHLSWPPHHLFRAVPQGSLRGWLLGYVWFLGSSQIKLKLPALLLCIFCSLQPPSQIIHVNNTGCSSTLVPLRKSYPDTFIHFLIAFVIVTLFLVWAHHKFTATNVLNTPSFFHICVFISMGSFSEE